LGWNCDLYFADLRKRPETGSELRNYIAVITRWFPPLLTLLCHVCVTGSGDCGDRGGIRTPRRRWAYGEPVTEEELAKALTGRTPAESVARWMALTEMEWEVGVEAVRVDFEIEGTRQDRQLEVWKILGPHMKTGARTWRELHDALSPAEHDRVEDLLADL
jgi:hypothetical protein